MGGGNISTWLKNFVLSIGSIVKHGGDSKQRTSIEFS